MALLRYERALAFGQLDAGSRWTNSNAAMILFTPGTTAEALLRRYQCAGFAREDVLATVKALEEVAGVQVRGTWDEDNA